MSRDSRDTQLDALRAKLYSRADAKLRRLVDERVDPFRNIVPRDIIPFNARASDGTVIETGLTGVELVNILVQAIIDERRNTTRQAEVDIFLRTVDGMGE